MIDGVGAVIADDGLGLSSEQDGIRLGFLDVLFELGVLGVKSPLFELGSDIVGGVLIDGRDGDGLLSDLHRPIVDASIGR